ncbi:uracil-DNA glycosylase [uncultured Sphingomonas sp.]|uniref:uracil-DNA glycosylase n=1 Tax=uncultured Sphingomonas sp. TaxID=158754 RepID=UPI00262E5A7B|nr:uracil-DNA glycosylase [uncultured Sphingomonas sp.]
MGAYQTIDPALAASALDWWHDAGVDLIVGDDPFDWLAAPPHEAFAPMPGLAPVAAPAPVVAAPAAPSALPDTLEAFATWRMGPEAPEQGWTGISLAATGPADAAIMVLVDCPDRDDGQANRLLSGAPGRLFDRMLAAIGLSRDSVHVAAVCARRPAAGRMPRELETRLGEVSRHHVGLIAPKRLLLLGNAASRAILGTEMGQARGILHRLNHRTGTEGAAIGSDTGSDTGVVASFHPRFLLEKPVAKAEAWRDLQLLMKDIGA